jgi:hypothetical protein
MTEQQEITLGEIQRTLLRLEAGQEKLTDAIAPLSGLQIRVHTAERDIEDLQTDVKGAMRGAATVSGGISVLAFVASLWAGHK